MRTCNVIDLFAGAGGLGPGAVEAGCNLRLSVDNDPWSCRTLEANADRHGGNVLKADVLGLTGEMLRDDAGLADDDLNLSEHDTNA